MKYLMLFLVIAAPVFAGERFVTLMDGSVITVPEWAETCEYDERYCVNGWLPDGTFPILPLREAVLECFDKPEPRVLICPDGLVLSPSYCTDAVTNEQVEVVDCGGELAISPSVCSN